MSCSRPKTRLDEAGGLTVADVIHRRFTALAASATIGEIREWFAASTSRRMALLAAADGCYAGSLTPEHVAGDLDPDLPASVLAQHWPTVPPDAPAATAEHLALLTPARRVPVVDGDGRLLGVVSVTSDLKSFCGTD
jgi:CBS-domain-containing membrane protein